MLDEEALDRALGADPDATLAMVADLVHATDESLRRHARTLAARLVLDRSRAGRVVRAGTSRPRLVPASRGGDLDVEASLDGILTARGEHRPVDLDDLTARDWGKQDLALCLLVDASGSMNGERLAVAATVTAACTMRAPAQHAVLAFAGEVRTLRPLQGTDPAATVVDRVLGLRGHGVTNLADALRAASAVLAAARAQRRVVVLLSDCRHTDEDPVPVARLIPELVVLAPRDDSEQARALAAAAGARWGELDGADSAPAPAARAGLAATHALPQGPGGGQKRRGSANSMAVDQVTWVSTGARMPPEARRSRPTTRPSRIAANPSMRLPVARVATV